MNVAERAYRLLLRAYPARFRATYAREMEQLFRDRRRETGAGNARFWRDMVLDVARSAPAQQWETSRSYWDHNIHMKEAKMKSLAIVAIMIGSLEVVNSAAEAWVGGVMLHGTISLAGGAIGALAGAALVAAAIAMLRRTPRAAALANGAAIACLAVFALIALLSPMFSMFATILGIGFPIVLLVALRSSSHNGSSPTAA